MAAHSIKSLHYMKEYIVDWIVYYGSFEDSGQYILVATSSIQASKIVMGRLQKSFSHVEITKITLDIKLK